MALNAAGQAYRRVGSTWSPATPALSGGLTGVSAPGSLFLPDHHLLHGGGGTGPVGPVDRRRVVAAHRALGPGGRRGVVRLALVLRHHRRSRLRLRLRRLGVVQRASGAWGAANDISCVSPNFSRHGGGRAHVWDGGSWTQPSGADTAGQLDAVSCTSPTYCLAVDTAGDAFTYNGSAWVGPTKVEASRGSAFGGPSGLSGVVRRPRRPARRWAATATPTGSRRRARRRRPVDPGGPSPVTSSSRPACAGAMPGKVFRTRADAGEHGRSGGAGRAGAPGACTRRAAAARCRRAGRAGARLRLLLGADLGPQRVARHPGRAGPDPGRPRPARPRTLPTAARPGCLRRGGVVRARRPARRPHARRGRLLGRGRTPCCTSPGRPRPLRASGPARPR